MHGARVAQAAQSLGGHGPLHRMEIIGIAGAVNRAAEIKQYFSEIDGCSVSEINGNGVFLYHIIRIAQVPGNIVHIAKSVATGAGGLAIARKARSVIQHRPALDHGEWFRIGQGLGCNFMAGSQVNYLD